MLAIDFYISSDMSVPDMSKVKSSVPCGFTRLYALHLLSVKPMTGMEIIGEAERRSDGEWRPSPGLIYPLIGRLLKDGLISEAEGGKFAITAEGVEALEQRVRFQRQLENQFNLVQKLGLSMFTAGKLITEEAMDRINNVTSQMKERVARDSEDLQERFYENYRSFLESELEKMKTRENEVLGESVDSLDPL